MVCTGEAVIVVDCQLSVTSNDVYVEVHSQHENSKLLSASFWGRTPAITLCGYTLEVGVDAPSSLIIHYRPCVVNSLVTL